MATTTSLTTTYAGKEAGAYIKSAFYANETLKHITVKENIDYKQVVRKLVDTITFADDTCDFTPTGTVTLTERVLTLEKFQVHRQLCKNDFLADWQAIEEQNDNLNASLTEAMIANMLGGIAQRNEYLIWQGVAANAGEARSKPKAFGLRGLQERARTVGGWLDVSSRPGQGTSVIVSLPLPSPSTDPTPKESAL